MSKVHNFELVPFDPEIERTIRRRLREQQSATIVEAMADQDANVINANALPGVDDRDRVIMEYGAPILGGLNPSIARPEIQANQFKLKTVMFQMLQTVGQFSAFPTDDPHLHLKLFMEVSDSFK